MGSHVLGPFVVIGNQIYLGNLGPKYIQEPCFPFGIWAHFALGSVVS